MADFLSAIAPGITSIIGWVGDVATLIVDTPILLFTTSFLAIGGAIGIFSRLLAKS